MSQHPLPPPGTDPQPGWGSPAGPAEPEEPLTSRGRLWKPLPKGCSLRGGQGSMGKGSSLEFPALCAIPRRCQRLLTRDSPGCTTPLLTLSPLLSPPVTPTPSQTPQCSLPPLHKTPTSLIPRQFPTFSLSLSLFPRLLMHRQLRPQRGTDRAGRVQLLDANSHPHNNNPCISQDP